MPSTAALRPWPSRASRDVRVEAIRGHDLAGRSDGELRHTLQRVGAPGGRDGPAQALPEVFAVVDEAVRRRLGAWRLFSGSFEQGAASVYREAARRVLEAASYRSQVGYYADEGFLDGTSFHDSIAPLLRETDLDPDERTIVATIVYVAEKRKVAYESDILLPAEFYKALSAKDTDGSLSFKATNEQLLAGRLLYEGRVVEMDAGEGKTVAAAFPAVLHAVAGRRVHVITANDYLATRDAEWLAPVYESLGLTVRAVLSHMSDAERRHAYGGDIVYGTLREMGFDLLRDNLRYSADELVQGPLDVAIVDEADQALVDEARTPLIISGAPSGAGRSIHKVRKAVEELKARQREVVSDLEERLAGPGLGARDRRLLLARMFLADPDNGGLVRSLAADTRLRRRVQALVDTSVIEGRQDSLAGDLYYAIDARNELVTLTERGQELMERRLGPIFDSGDLEREVQRVESSEDLPLAERRRAGDRLRRQLSRRHNQMNQAYQMMRACLLHKKDVDYVVTDGEVVLVDRLTGRRRPDSRYQHGLQACLEAKEGVTVHPEGEVLAQVSVQGFMKQYSHVSGMTGTALASRDEFRRAYGLDVVRVPPSHALKRSDFPTRLYASRRDKLLAVLDEVTFRHRMGQPVLVGTLSVEQSEEMSRILDRHGVRHRLLNAVNSSAEAEVVRTAGSYGAVTVATNMAGRGTDIILEPGLDRQIVRRCAALVREMLDDGASQVALDCATREEAGLLRQGLAASGGLSVTTAERGGRTEVVVTGRPGGEKGEKTVRVQFGAGLHVIGTELNDSTRVDSQLRGRGGRQGEFGSSRFMLSVEDRPLVVRAPTGPGISHEMRRDATGRPFYEGPKTGRRLDSVQAAIEMQDEAVRTAAWDYGQAVERQTLSFYRARREVVESGSFLPACERFMRSRARRLVDEHFPPAMIGRYASQFDKMAEELSLDYQIDVEPLWGLGPDALGDGIERLMLAGLEEKRARAGGPDLDRMARLLFLQTGDELWVEHLSRLQDLMLTTRLCGYGHKTAVAEYLLRSARAYEAFREEVIDTFLPRLVTFPTDASSVPRRREVVISEEIQAILV